MAQFMNAVLEPGSGGVQKTDQAVSVFVCAVYQTLPVDGFKPDVVGNFPEVRSRRER